MKLPTYQDLSKKQDRIYNLPLEESYIITGPPGTGKTVMALYRASMYQRQEHLCRLIIYSRFLSQYLQSAVDELNLDSEVQTFHSWTWNYYRNHFGSRPPQYEKFKNNWEKISRQLLKNPPPEEERPYVIVDEGQDMPADFYMAVPHLSRTLTVFADENQRISERQSTLDDIRSRTRIDREVHLKKNYRNTLEIARVARAFYTGSEDRLPELPDREGRKPVVGRTDDLDDFVDFLLNFEELYSDLDIGVLTQTHSTQRKIESRLVGKTKNSVQHYRREKGKPPPNVDFDKPGIRLVTFASAKGLEFDVVFIPELQRVNLDPSEPSTKMKFYVLVSRAREELFVTYSGTERPELLDLFPEDLIEWRE